MTDLITDGPGILTNLVSMICLFIQERRYQKDLNHNEFLEWLDNHHFEELKRIIESTHGLTQEIDELLLNRQDQILSEIKLVGNAISKVASELKSWKRVVDAIPRKIGLSEQALLILDLAELEETCNIFYMPNHYPYPFLIIGNRGWDAPDPRFLHDDIGDLLSLDFITLIDRDDRGNPIFRLTRSGCRFVLAMAERPSMRSSAVIPDEQQRFLFTIKLKRFVPTSDMAGTATACMNELTNLLMTLAKPNVRSERAVIYINIECADLSEEMQGKIAETGKRFGYAVSSMTKR